MSDVGGVSDEAVGTVVVVVVVGDGNVGENSTGTSPEGG